MSGEGTAHRRLKKQLLARIATMHVGERLPPERELAGEYSVSRMTINKIMVELRREGHLRRERGRGTFVSPASQIVESGMSGREGGTVVMAFPDWFSYSVWDMVNQAEAQAVRENIDLLNFKIRGACWFDSFLELCARQQNLRGVILVPPGSGLSGEQARALGGLPGRVVGIFYSEYAEIVPNFYSVSNSDFLTGYRTFEYLASLGYARVALIPNEPWSTGSEALAGGFVRAARDLGRGELLVPGYRAGVFSKGAENALLMLGEVFSRAAMPDCCVFQSFSGALAGLRYLAGRGLRVPENIGVVSLSGHNDFEEMLVPALTVIESDRRELIGRAFGCLLEQGAGEKIQRLEVRVFARDSVRTIGG